MKKRDTDSLSSFLQATQILPALFCWVLLADVAWASGNPFEPVRDSEVVQPFQLRLSLTLHASEKAAGIEPVWQGMPTSASPDDSALKLSLALGGGNEVAPAHEPSPFSPGGIQPVIRKRDEEDSLESVFPALAFNLGKVRSAQEDEDQEDVPAPLASPSTGTGSSLLPDFGATSWGLAPIRYSGNYTSSFSLTEDPEGNRSKATSRVLSLDGSSYFMEPWIAQMSATGTIGASSASSETGAQEGSESSSRILSLGMSANILPQSPFPLNVNMNYGNTSTNIENNDSANTYYQMNANQSFRPRAGETASYAWGAGYNNSSDSYGNQLSAYNLGASYSDSIEYQAWSGGVGFSSGTLDPGGERQGSSGRSSETYNNFNLTGGHRWDYSDELQLSSNAQFIYNDSSSLLGAYENRAISLTSNGIYRPFDENDELLPYTIMGGASFNNFSQSINEQGFDNTFANANASINYQFSPQLSGGANAAVGATTASGGDMVSYLGGGANLGYYGLPINWAEYVYSWGVNGNAGFQTVSNSDTIIYAASNLYHSVNRGFDLAGFGGVSLAAGQGFSASYLNTGGNAFSFNHNASASLYTPWGPSASSNFSGTVTDIRTYGDYSSSYTSLTLSGTGQLQLSPLENITASGSLSWNRQENQQSLVQFGERAVNVQQPSSWVGFWNVNYSRANLFNIRRLNYTASMYGNHTQLSGSVDTRFGTVSGTGWTRTIGFFHQANYFFGRLSFQVTNSFADTDGKRGAIIFFQTSRSLGN